MTRAADGFDYLVNAAAIIRLVPIFETTPNDWRDIFAVNAEAVFFLCQRSARGCAPGGAIVNLSSTSAKVSSTTEAAIYAASKAAVISITRSFAYALASRPVRVNAVCPGITDTPMQERVLDDVARDPRHDLRGAGETPRLTRRAARAHFPAGRVRRRDPLPALRRGRLHDRAGDQLRRRAGDDVTSGKDRER